jgi:hypothetical protein
MTEVALSSLRPIYRRVYKNFDPRTGGEPTDEFELSFSCPKCGPPTRIAITVGPNMDAARRVWQVSPTEPFVGWVDVITVSPSIDYSTAGHGKHRPPCPFHGHIVNGKVVFP